MSWKPVGRHYMPAGSVAFPLGHLPISEWVF